MLAALIVTFLAIAIVIGIFYLKNVQKFIVSDVPKKSLELQAILSPTKNDGESHILRNSKTPFGKPLVQSIDENSRTVYDMFQAGLKRNPEADYLGKRINDGPFVFESYRTVAKRVINFGSGAKALFNLDTQSKFGIFFKNTPEWAIIDHSCSSYSLVSVPMYETYDEESLKYIVNNSSISVVATAVSGIDKVFAIKSNTEVLKFVVIVDQDEIPEALSQRADELNLKLFTLKQVEKYGEKDILPVVPPKDSDVYTICYTSGTTGAPKGVMQTHRYFAAAVAAILELIPADKIPSSKDRHISYLPLAHVFERSISLMATYFGCKIGYYRGDILKLFDDIEQLKPTIFPSVPRLLSRLYDKIVLSVSNSSFIKKQIFNFAFQQKLKLLRNGIVTKNSVWDKLVFGKIQKKLGGEVRFMITGAAPIAADVMDYLRVLFGCNILEAYGQTEALGFYSSWGDYQWPYGSHVGTPFSSSEAKLIDVPSMNYYSTDKPNPRGEILIRGNVCMKGYFNDSEKTRETLDAEGWVHTGDVGELLPNLTLKIVDRVKNIFKLSQGEYIIPEKIEMKIKSPEILQSFVYGNSLMSHLVAIIIPDSETIFSFAKKHGIECSKLSELCQSEQLKKIILNQISVDGLKNGLHKFEIPKAIYLHSEQFSVENGLLTPTFKLKRKVVQDKFQKELDMLYSDNLKNGKAFMQQNKFNQVLLELIKVHGSLRCKNENCKRMVNEELVGRLWNRDDVASNMKT
ncbi:Long-chain-fatty-acid--CoA ligase 1 [Lobulomyces angularis]|nr:Long-chain-fatty-acid--CoA ligase 1 [Lobulomyces angularis]